MRVDLAYGTRVSLSDIPGIDYKRWTTSYPSDNGDYTCNERLCAGAFVSGSNRTQMNQYLQLLKMPVAIASHLGTYMKLSVTQ